MLLADNILQATALGTVLECKSINGKWPRPNPGLQSYRITKIIFSQSFLTSSLQTNNKRQHNYCLPIFESKCPLLTPASKALFFMTFKIIMLLKLPSLLSGLGNFSIFWKHAWYLSLILLSPCDYQYKKNGKSLMLKRVANL